jgi:hypothetical protein
MNRTNAILVGLLGVLSVVVACAEPPSRFEEGTRPTGDITEYRGGRVFDGKRFVEQSVCTSGETIVACDGPVAAVVELQNGFVVPPFGDAHTHHFDGPYTLAWHRSMSLKAGVFYAMTMTAPTSQVLQIRDRLSGPKNVDVASSLGGITGPDSHPAEIYEALALGFRSYEEQLAHAEEIRASRKSCLANELDAIDRPFVLALDDYHRIAPSSDVHELLGFLLDHPPRNLHLVLLTRTDPPLSLTFLRGRGGVAEVRLQDL